MTYTRKREHHSKKQRSACIRVHPVATRQPDRGRTRFCEYLVSRQKGFEPMEQLPPEYVLASKPKRPCGRPPRLYFGLDITCDMMCSYAIKHLLHPPELTVDHKQRYSCMLKVVEHLAQLCGANLSLQAPLWSTEDEWLIARYSNYNPFSYMKAGPPDEEVFAILCRELAISTMPKWYQSI